jgi:DNA-binding MarR family transcriptional regulator
MPKQHYHPDTFHARDSLGYLLKHAHRLMIDRVEAEFEAKGFTFQQWIMLLLIRDGIALTPAELCRETRHDSGAMTRLLDQLEQRGFVERRRCREDRRVVELKLTPAGRSTVTNLIPVVVNCLNGALTDFTSEEVLLFKDFLHRLIARVGELNAQRDAAAAEKRS